LAISYYAASKDGSNTEKSYNTFGTESQINFAASGDLNNGMKYAAGFSWEMDGGETLNSMGGATEGTYIEFISGGTTLGISTDRAGTVDGKGTSVNFAGFGYAPISGMGTSIVGTTFNKKVDNGFGFNVQQKIADGVFSANYIPNTGALATQDIGNSASKTANDNGESAYEITYTGKIAGADIFVGMVNVNSVANSSAPNDLKGEAYSIAYPFGKAKVGVSRGVTKSQASTVVKDTTTQYGVGYALSDALSVSVARTIGDRSTSSKDETIDILALGYNLGPVSVQLQYKDAADIGGTAGADGQQLGMYVSTKF
jgi:hypothetical protein